MPQNNHIIENNDEKINKLQIQEQVRENKKMIANNHLLSKKKNNIVVYKLKYKLLGEHGKLIEYEIEITRIENTNCFL
ncbi:MAG: hypothetical protein RSF67_07375 [Clostridia bacterium]